MACCEMYRRTIQQASLETENYFRMVKRNIIQTIVWICAAGERNNEFRLKQGQKIEGDIAGELPASEGFSHPRIFFLSELERLFRRQV